MTILFLCALGLLAVGSTEAQALRITEAAHTGPIAYELKSLQTTHFYATVDTPGVWAILRIKDGQGRTVKTIYDGPIQQAHERFWFPVWNGLDNSGKRLFSANWRWELTTSKGGVSYVRSGSIIVSKIHFSMRGRAKAGSPDLHQKYMIPGNANVYMRLSTSGQTPGSTFKWTVYSPSGEWWQWNTHYVRDYDVVDATQYLHHDRQVVGRGMHDWNLEALASSGDISYYMTVIQ